MNLEEQMAGLVGRLPDGITEGVALGTGLADGYDLYDSPLGRVAVAFNTEGLSSVDLADDDFEQRFIDRFGRSLLRAEAPRAWSRHIPEAIEAGTPGRLPVDLRSVTSFQEGVLRVAAQIPRGEVRPYAWLAHEVQRPGAVRAVGSTMARNPVPLIIPCHRVVRSDGHIGAYSLGGPHNKQELLSHEGLSTNWLEELASKGVRLRANTSTGIYCHPTCHRIQGSKEDNVVDFTSSDQAAEAGFRPCKVCRPH
jgi:O-6-methylguanine DNA methyltransferase